MTLEGDELDTSAADTAIEKQRQVRGRVDALVRLVKQSMEQPGGMAWEEEIAAPETEEAPAPEGPKTSAMEEREARWREEFTRNWPDKPPRK